MSDQSATEGAAPEVEEKTPEGPPEWLTPIQERMQEQHELMGRMADTLAGLTERPAEDDFDEEDYVDDDDEVVAAQRFVDDRVEQRLSAELSKRDAAQALNERDAMFEDLVREIPALQDDKYLAELVKQAQQELADAGVENLTRHPYVVQKIEDLHYRRGARERVAETGEQANQKEVVLESGSGASVQQTDQEDWAGRVLKAAETLKPQI